MARRSTSDDLELLPAWSGLGPWSRTGVSSAAGIQLMAGRPTDYQDGYAAIACKMAELGATDQELADAFDVDVRTVYRWKHDQPAFCQALKTGKDVADERVERSLYQKAIGYEQDEFKIFMPGGATEPVYAPFRAKIAPDTTAAIFWLKNRRGNDWRDKTLVGSDPENPLPSAVSLAGLSPATLRELAGVKLPDEV